MSAAQGLRRAAVDVTIIDRTNHHLFQPLLYQVATGILSEGEIAPAIRDVLRWHRNVTVRWHRQRYRHQGVVTANRMGATSEIPYDSLILATGVQTSYFGHDDFANRAPGLKSIDDALDSWTDLRGIRPPRSSLTNGPAGVDDVRRGRRRPDRGRDGGPVAERRSVAQPELPPDRSQPSQVILVESGSGVLASFRVPPAHGPTGPRPTRR